MKTRSFNAPWDTGVKLLTMLVSAILGYYIFTYVHHHAQGYGPDFMIRLVLPLFLLGLGVAFMVTGYSIDSEGIVIHRIFWRRRILRSEISGVSVPSVLDKRGKGIWGIWGFCGYSGLSYSSTRGFHIVAASGSANRVFISRNHGMPFIISPSDPDAFIRAFRDTGAVIA